VLLHYLANIEAQKLHLFTEILYYCIAGLQPVAALIYSLLLLATHAYAPVTPKSRFQWSSVLDCYARLHDATVVQPVVPPVGQPVGRPIGCLFTRYHRLYRRMSNRLDNGLRRVNGILRSHSSGEMKLRVFHSIRCKVHWCSCLDERQNCHQQRVSSV